MYPKRRRGAPNGAFDVFAKPDEATMLSMQELFHSTLEDERRFEVPRPPVVRTAAFTRPPPPLFVRSST